jgi:acetyl esterase/lipase/lambda repressor-like predicted transcriptional regulator
MRRSTQRMAMAGALSILASCAQAPKRPAGPPSGIAVYARHPQFIEARISPKGTYLAAISVEAGQRSLTFVRLATREFVSRLKPDRGTMVGDFHWVNDERVVAELVDMEGDLAAPKRYGEIYAVDASGKNGLVVFGYRTGRLDSAAYIHKAEPERAWGFYLDRPRGDSRRVLVGAIPWREVGDVPARLYLVDTYTGAKTQVAVSPMPRAGFVTDENGSLALAFARDADLKGHAFLWEGIEGWRELELPSSHAQPVGFVAADRTVYFSVHTKAGFELYAAGLDGGHRKLLARNDTVPPSRLVHDRTTGRIVAVAFEPDLPTWEFVEPEHPLSRVLRGLLAARPDEQVVLVDSTEDQRKAVVLVYSDRNPGQYLLVDVVTMTAEEIIGRRPWIRPEAMAETTAFHITASDGLRIHGYLTLPRARPEGRPPPLVVYPHGGPHFIRDRWGFDSMVQFLASEGFAVLQVNYRGSGGYGEAFQTAGFGHWGDRMVEDVVDAAGWAIRKGHVDGDRACTFGGSYGAYAALRAATLAPDLFRCAIGYAGVYDLEDLSSDAEWSESTLSRGYFRKALGRDDGLLERMSPVNSAADIRAHVLLIHGEKDVRAKFDQAKRMREALERAGNPPAWLVEPAEGHGFYDEEARERMFARVLAFLRENTGPPAPK